jgi:putative transposase
MSSPFIFVHLLPPVSGPVARYRQRFSRFVTNSRFSKRARRVASASIAPTDCCDGRDSGRIGATACADRSADTVIRWHRRDFAWYWTRKSPRHPGRSEVAAEIRDLIRRMSQVNALWGTPRIHGELLKLGIEVAQSTVAKYLGWQRKPPSQPWRTFLANHMEQMASIDFFTVPTATFRVLFVFVVLSHARRRVVHFRVTEHPTQEWTKQQLREAFPWDQAPRYLLRDQDAIYGSEFAAMTKGMGVEEVVTAPRAPWQNPFVERLVCSKSRTHLSLGKHAPISRPIQPPAMGRVVEIPQVGGLHHLYTRKAA